MERMCFYNDMLVRLVIQLANNPNTLDIEF